MADKFQNTIIIKFSAVGDQNVIKAINALDRSTKALINTQAKLHNVTEKSTKKNKSLTKGLFELNHSARNTAGAFSVIRSQLLLFNFAMGLGIRQMMKMVQTSAQVDSMERAFTTLSGGTEDARVAMDSLREATNGTMSQFDLFQQANNAMILGVADNSETMAEMFDIAQRLGRALGRDTASSVESLITGIGRQSRLMLDNIGIIVKADDAYQAYAEALDITVDELTDADKKQAFLNATMDAARSKVALLGDEVLTAENSFNALKASTADLAVEIGVSLTPLFEKMAKETTGAVVAMTELMQIANHVTGAELRFVEAEEEAINFIEQQSKALGVNIDKNKSLSEQLDQLIPKYRGWFSTMKNEGLRIQTELNESQEAYNHHLEKTKKLTESIEPQQPSDGLTQDDAMENIRKNALMQQIIYEMDAEKHAEALKKKELAEDSYYNGLSGAIEKAKDELKSLQDEAQSANETLISNAQSSLSAFGSVLSAWQNNLQSRMDAELSALRDTKKFQDADAERRKDMEREITKGYQQEQIRKFRIGQASALADIGMNTASALMKSVAGSWVTIGQPWFGIISALGALQAGMVMSQKPPSFETGGMIGGRRHSQGGTIIEAEQGEFVMSRNAVQSIGVETLNQMNQSGNAGITLNISAPLVDETVVDTIIPAIQKAQRMNLA